MTPRQTSQSGRESPVAVVMQQQTATPGSARQVAAQTPRTPGVTAAAVAAVSQPQPSPRRPASSQYVRTAPSPSSSAGGSLSARPYSARASSSQGTGSATAHSSARPSGSATARAAPVTAASPSASAHRPPAPSSARARVGGQPPSVPVRGPQPAWTKGSRASSASPEPSAVAGAEHGTVQAAPLSARDEAMRSARSTFNVPCTSPKAPRQILQEVQRALTTHRVAFRQSSAWSLRCQKVAVCFEVEIAHHVDNADSYLVRFKRVAGEVNQYKDQVSKILAEMRI